MKKLVFIITLVVIMVVAPTVSAAGFVGIFNKPASSWQTYTADNVLTVHDSVEYSPICFQGGVEWYDGGCTLYGQPTNQFMQRLRAERR